MALKAKREWGRRAKIFVGGRKNKQTRNKEARYRDRIARCRLIKFEMQETPTIYVQLQKNDDATKRDIGIRICAER